MDLRTRGATLCLRTNLIQTPGAQAINGTNSGNITGQDPLLGGLSDNGGGIPTRVPAANSLALNAGSSAGAPAFDARGIPRSLGGVIDIGAVEVFANTNPLLVDSIDGFVDSDFSAGHLSLPEAILLSNAGTGSATVRFAPGLTGTIALSKELPIIDDVTITGPGANVLAVSGGDGIRIGSIGALAETIISGLAFKNGSFPQGSGGAFGVEGNLTLTDCNFSGCKAASGGALDVHAGVTLSLDGCIFEGNGAGIKGGALFAKNATVAIEDSFFVGNTAAGRGGAVALYHSTEPDANTPIDTTITNSVFDGNTSGSRGGGAHLYKVAADLSGLVITGNTAANRGGGMHLYKCVTSMDQCTISGNTSNGYSGGGLNLYKGSALIEETTISGNSCTLNNGFGGGIAFYKAGSTTLQNCTIDGNSAPRGANVALFAGGGTTTVKLANSTVSGGGANNGITVISGDLTLSSCLVSGNLPADVAGTLNVASDHNLIGAAGAIGIVNGAAGNQIGTTGSPIDPKLGPLADNGGPTKTRRLLPGSPALGTGSNALSLTRDQRGFQRTRNGVVDVGALQAQPLTNVSFAPGEVAENSLVGTSAGVLTPIPSEPNNPVTFQFVTGAGSTDNGLFQIVGNQVQTAAVFDFEQQASRSIRLRATNQFGFTLEGTLPIVILNVNEAPSVQSAMVSDASATIGQVLTFSAVGTDPDNEPLNYLWTFSDGTTATGATVTKAFNQAGSFTAFVTVSDFAGLTASSDLLAITVTAAGIGAGIDKDGDGFSDSFETAAGTSTATATAPEARAFKTLTVSLNFNPKTNTRTLDLITLKGDLPTTTTDFTNKTVAVDVGGAPAIFTLGKTGKSPARIFPSFAIGKPNKKTGTAVFTATLKGNFKGALSDEGLTNVVTPKTGKPVQIRATVGFEGKLYTLTFSKLYKLPKVNATGAAR